MNGTALIHTDGGSRGNPGPSAYAYVIVMPDGLKVVEGGGKLGSTTNNIAEYQGLRHALLRARSLGLKSLRVHSDSELMVKQLKGVYKVKADNLMVLYTEIQTLLRGFEAVQLLHVLREKNKRADELCNLVMDNKWRPEDDDGITHLSAPVKIEPLASLAPEPKRRVPKAGPPTRDEKAIAIIDEALTHAAFGRADTAAEIWQQLKDLG